MYCATHAMLLPRGSTMVLVMFGSGVADQLPAVVLKL
jgi:hypothetical protein